MSQNKKTLGIVHSIHHGKVAAFHRSVKSAIVKMAVDSPVVVSSLGIVGDEHADTIHHGGIDKAIHIYPYEHYLYWKRDIGDVSLLDSSGAFGENFSTLGFTERDIYLGDKIKVGDVLLEISQGRQLCWKLNDHFGVTDMAIRVQDSLRTGFYCRVLSGGVVMPKTEILLETRGNTYCSLRDVMTIMFQDEIDKHALTELLKLPLVPNWKTLIMKRLEYGKKESFTKRIHGPISE